MITFNDIYEIARKERYSEQMQKLPKDFLKEVFDYLREKKNISLNGEELSDEVIKTKKQLENAITIFKELMRERKKKILTLVLVATETGTSKKDSENMFDFEKELFEELMKCVLHSEEKINDVLNGKAGSNFSGIIFLSDVDEFLGFDGEKIGPFKKGDSVNLHPEIAKILIEDGKAELSL
ncbi:MAG: hypothetical protein ABIH49_02700 [archaeon]